MEHQLDISKIKEIAKRGPGQPTKYDESIHRDMVIDLFARGASVVEFCCHAGICRQTFYNSWLKIPEFKYAYKLALQLAQVHWEHYPIDCEEEGRPYNYQHYFLLMKNRFGFSQIKKSKDVTVAGKLKSAWGTLLAGKITPQEFNSMVSRIVGELRCTEMELKAKELEIKLQELETFKELNQPENQIKDLKNDELTLLHKVFEENLPDETLKQMLDLACTSKKEAANV